MPQRQIYVQRSTRQSFRSAGHNKDQSWRTIHNWELCIMADSRRMAFAFYFICQFNHARIDGQERKRLTHPPC